ncbi:MAG: peptidase M22 [Clostridiales bacterium]|nr:peptidase M22 [Clostridiales bacterium]
MYIGFDTSNYTTSVALFDGKNAVQNKKLLSVKSGEKGLRQSDAVFQHTVNMPDLLSGIVDEKMQFNAVAVSSRPRNIDGSYMPCFLVGVNSAVSFSKACACTLYKTSHQVGHILSALYSADRLDLINDTFIAFHVSGGTTEALLVTPDDNEIIKARVIAQSTDLKAGQAIDRVGVMLGLDFPCGPELDLLAQNSEKQFKIKSSMKGLDCSLSGVENKARKMIDDGASNEDVAKFVISYIDETIALMTERIISHYGNLPLIYAGGVMSNSIIQKHISEKFNAYFAKSEFSCDNAVGIAIYAYLKDKNDSNNRITS